MERTAGEWAVWRDAVRDLFAQEWGFRPDISLLMAERPRVRDRYDRGLSPEEAVREEIRAESLEL